MSVKEKDGLRDILDKLETPAVRWALVCIGVVVLVRLRLILFAAALPVMAYWHYSNHSGAEASATDAGEDEPPARAGEDNYGGDDGFDNNRRGPGRASDEVYDEDFWNTDGQQPPRSAPSREAAGGRSAARATVASEDNPLGSAWDDDPSGGPADDFPKPKSNMDDILGSLGSGFGSMGGDDDFGLGKVGDFDFLGSGGGDFLSMSMGDGFGKGKGKGKKGEGKGDKGPREANPKQVFVAGVGDLPEDEIRMFFEDVGEVDRLKLLTNEDGSSKGVCFVTFREESQAKQALSLHGSDLAGRNITVRLAHGGNKGKDGDKGGGKGEGKRDREPRMDFGPSERFGSAFGDGGGDRNTFDRPRDKGKGGGKGGSRGGREKGEMDDLLEEVIAEQEGPVKAGDFDFAARRFLMELRSRDKADGTTRFNEAMDMVIKYTQPKERSAVRKWPAYIYTLLQKFDPQLADELRERDAARRSEKGSGRDRPPRDMGNMRDRDDDRD